MRILIADDNLAARQNLIEYIIKNHGIYNIDEAASGAEAVRKVKEVSYDVILLDIVLGDIEGTEVLKRIRQENKNIIAIIMTAMTTNRIYEECKKYNANYYLTKPINFNMLDVYMEVLKKTIA